MKKTSKKLLSFFLAVVMVVTSCSVGITAFAAENENTMWTTDADAKTSFEALNALANGYLPSALLGIGAVKDGIYSRYASDGKLYSQLTAAEKAHVWNEDGSLANADKCIYTADTYKSFDRIEELKALASPTEEEANELASLQKQLFFTANKEKQIASETEISDIIEVLIPTLMGVSLFGIKQSAEDFVNRPEIIGNVNNYNYLNTAGDGQIDFYTLYALCADNRNNKDLDSSTRELLSNWYDELYPLAMKYKELEASLDQVQSLVGAVAELINEDYKNASLYELQQDTQAFFQTSDGQMVKEAYSESLKTYMGEVKEYCDSYFTLDPITIDDDLTDFAKAIYYRQDENYDYLEACLYYHIIAKNAGVSFDYTGDLDVTIGNNTNTVSVDATGITPANLVEKLGDDIVTAFGYASYDEFASDLQISVVALKSRMAKSLQSVYFDDIIKDGEYSVNTSKYYDDALNGIAIEKGLYKTTDDFNKAVLETLPEGFGEGDVLSVDDILEISYVLRATQGAPADQATYFGKGSLVGYTDQGRPANTNKKTVDATLPSAIANTAVADYFALFAGSSNNTVRTPFLSAFLGTNATGTCYLLGKDGSKVSVRNGKTETLRDSHGHSIVYLDEANPYYNIDAINAYINNSYKYAKSRIIAEAYGAKLSVDQTNVNYKVESIVDVSEIASMIQSENYNYSPEVILEEGEGYNPDNYKLDRFEGVDIVNNALNQMIVSVLSGDLADTINGLFTTDVDLVAAIEDVLLRLYNDPVQTVFELAPLVMVVLDELLEAFILNGEGDQYYGLVQNIVFGDSFFYGLKESLGLDIGEPRYDHGSYIGIAQVGWDLNVLLPNLMNWLLYGADKAAENGITFYPDHTATLEMYDGELEQFVEVVKNYKTIDSADPRNYTVLDQDGNELKRTTVNDVTTFSYKGSSNEDIYALLNDYKDAEFKLYTHYEGSVPYLTGIYIADKALRDAEIADVDDIVIKALNDGVTDPDKIQSNTAIGTAIGEVVTEISTLFNEALAEYVSTPELVEQPKYDSIDQLTAKGLNNIFVAIPQLFDILENLAADKYGIDRDAWVYCYEGKIITDKTGTANSTLKEFKSYAGDPDAIDILDCFAEVFVENWLNAILSLVSNVVSTDNKISKNLPIITGLLNSLGGFGEDSIITDLLNSIFQITRDSDYSFTFTNNHTNPNNKLNGWNKDNAYFLICNISRLVEVIKNLITDFGGGSAQSEANVASTFSTYGADKTPTYKPGKTVDAKATSHNYTTGELSNTKDLIKNLDTMLSSLLSDSTINDFSLGSTETILAGVTSLLNKYLGKDVTVKDNETVTGVLRLVDSYLFYITGENKNLVAKNKAVNKKTVYSNNALTGLVVETYALIENIADALLSKQFTNSYEDGTIQYNLLTEAIDGIIAPDAISIRLDGYTDAQKTFAKYASWTEISQVTSRNGYNTLRIDWGFKDGDKEGFYDGLAASLRLVTSILGVLLVDTGWYNTVVTPVLGALCTKNGIHLTPYATLVASKKATGYYDETLKAVVSPIAKWIDKLLSAPASTLIKTVQGIAGVLDDKNKKAGTINSILEGAIKPITDEIAGVGNILNISSDKLLATSPTLANVIYGVAEKIYAFSDGANIQLGIEGHKYGLSGANLIPIVNSYLASTGITLKQISWSKIYSSTPEAALVYVVEYLLETILDNKNLTALAGLINNDIATMVIDAIKAGKLNAQELLGLINTILEATDSPTLAYWSFAQYLQEITENFKYPAGITKAMADKGVENLDGLVESLFPLLASLGVDLGGDNLKAIVNNKLFTNSLLTTIATALYGALDGLDPAIKGALKGLGIVSSTKDVAKILTDKSYGATYSSAAKTIASKSSWKNVKNVNWGFTDGSAKAHQGFVNALAAILRPVDNVLAVFLNEGSLKINEVLDSLINNLVVDATTTTLTIAEGLDIKLTYAMKNGVLTLKIVNPKSKDSQTSTVKLDLRSLKNLSDLKIEGTNGYNSAIIPLLEALGCTNIKTYAQYQRDIKAAKDSILLDILNPLLGAQDSSFLNKLLAAPVKELTALLPNIAMYLDGYGLEQLVFNLLAPVTNILVEAVDALNVDAILNELLGVTVDELLEDLSVADLIVPLINMILMSSDNEALNELEIPDINWNALISFGTASTYTSKATGENGSFLTGKILKNVDNGKVLITVLRYVAKTLINNASVLKNLICGIDAVAKNDTIKTVVASVFNTLSTATPDQVVCAIFYLFSGNPTNAFWDYTAYKTGDYSFSYPSTVDVEFLKNLPPMLDGLIGGLIEGGLNGLIGGKLFKDELIGKLATGLYGAVEGVKVGDGSLTALLAQTGIDFSTKNVAKLLTDEKYGQKFEAAASVIGSAGSWKNVKAESLKFGVTDRDSFFHALVAVLRPLYGVLDVLLNDASLSIFNIVHIPGSDGYTSSIVPLLEAFSCYNVKTQYQYREDIKNEYDAILLDVINPIWDKVEDILNAPLQTLTSMLPNLALLIGNDGLCQILDNLLTPVSALLDAIRPVVDLNTLLPALLSALKVDLNSLLGKIGIKDFKLDIYDINATLKQVLAGDKIIPLVNNILGIIKIKGTPLGIKLNDVDWLQLASHGKTIVGASQAATFGPRIYVEGDSSETLIAVLRYLIDTVNAGNNFDVISSLIGSLLGDNVSDSISDVIGNVLAVLQGDTDEVISKLVELLEMLA